MTQDEKERAARLARVKAEIEAEMRKVEEVKARWNKSLEMQKFNREAVQKAADEARRKFRR